MDTIVAKFGGSSLANTEQYRKVIDIVRSDPRRKKIIPSGSGSRPGREKDMKCTELALGFWENPKRGELFDELADRNLSNIDGLGLEGLIDISPALTRMRLIATQQDESLKDWYVSRPEYFSGLILTRALGPEWVFVDPTELIMFDENGCYDPVATAAAFARRTLPEYAVIPGWYGSMPSGEVKTFPRGGSDISGAVVAKRLQAAVYENWTDTNGVLAAHPRFVPNAKTIPIMSQQEIRELASWGASVFNPDAILPLWDSSTVVVVKNTNNPEHPGTRIVRNGTSLGERTGPVAGIAAREGFSAITISKPGMNPDRSFYHNFTGVLHLLGVSIEHVFDSVDSISVVIDDNELKGGKEGKILSDLRDKFSPSLLRFDSGFATIALVGETMTDRHGIAARAFGAVTSAGVNHEAYTQPFNQVAITMAVKASGCAAAVKALYREFMR